MSEGASLPARFLRTPEAGRFLGLSGRTLEKHRTYGTGPTYRKIGGRVVYAVADLQAWADRGTQCSTTDPARGAVSPARRTEALASSAGVLARPLNAGHRGPLARNIP
jgi:predicted DNA-binding transcriptional regulator AlpA